MSNENHNKMQPWKSKLEELKVLPEHSFDKSAAWEKLYQRVREKKEPGKKAGWYWLAAACVLFALLIPTFFINNNHSQKTAIQTKQKQPTSENPIVKIREKKNEEQKVNTLVPVKKSIAVDRKPGKILAKAILKNNINKLRLTDTVKAQNLAMESSDNFIAPLPASYGVVMAKPEKKKLRVVHVNELGDPVEESTGIEHNVSTHYFRIRFANQEVYTSHPVSTEKGITILKIKTSVN